MPTYALTIAGTPKSIKAGTLRINESINARNTMSFEVLSIDGSVYRPAMGAEVVYTEDATRLFGGLIDIPAERGFLPQGGSRLVNKVDALDFNAYADRRHIDGLIPAGTLKAALQVVEPYLTPYGVTLDAAQVTGPAVPAFTLPMVLIRKFLDDLSVLTGYVWEIDYNKVLRMYQPGSIAAPFNVVPASDPSVVLGDITVESLRNEYANEIIVLAGTGIREVTESFTGDGSTTVFPMLVGMAGSLVVTVNGVPVTVGTNGVDTTYEWTYRAIDNALVQLDEAPPSTPTTPLTGGDTLEATYSGQHPFIARASDAGEQATMGIWEKVIEEPDVFDLDHAQALAEAYLERYVTTFKTVRYTTQETGILPGQVQTITVPDRDLSGTFLVTDVETTDTVAHTFLRRVTAVGGTVLPGSWRDFYRRLSGNTSGGPPSSVIIGGGSGGSGVALAAPAYLGGSRNTTTLRSPAAWAPVVDWIPYTAQATFGGLVRAEIWARTSGVSVQCRLYDLTVPEVVATSSLVTSTTATEVEFLAGITIGHVYRLEVLSSADNQGVYAIGSLYSA